MCCAETELCVLSASRIVGDISFNALSREGTQRTEEGVAWRKKALETYNTVISVIKSLRVAT